MPWRAFKTLTNKHVLEKTRFGRGTKISADRAELRQRFIVNRIVGKTASQLSLSSTYSNDCLCEMTN